MKYVPYLTEKEIKYICSVIPTRIAREHFTKNPRGFNKIMTGHRVKSLKKDQVIDILEKGALRLKNKFILSFLEKNIDIWLGSIQSCIKQKIDKGKRKEIAWLEVLPESFFAGNIGIFFKLTKESVEPLIFELLESSIKRFMAAEMGGEEKNKKIERQEKETASLKKNIERSNAELEKLKTRLDKSLKEIRELKIKNNSIVKLELGIKKSDTRIKELEENLSKSEDIITQKTIEIKELSSMQLEAEEFQNNHTPQFIKQEVFTTPLCPKDMGEFKDFFGYNLKSLSLKTDADYYGLLIDYISNILFIGKPIVINKAVAFPLMRSITNTIVGTTDIATLSYSADISEEEIDAFLSADNRVMALDNFIGNFNETIITKICDKHKNKIIFLTVAYDKTLGYVPEEFMKYCSYLNINRIPEFVQEKNPTEDPSNMEEIENSVCYIARDNKYSRYIREILQELNIGNELTQYKSFLVSDEKSFCSLLLFDILPYCIDVLNIRVFNITERLNKYMKICPYKELLKRWFID